MADTAAHLVDRVLPEAQVRQWVLSLPFALRYRLAYDAPLTSAVLGIFVRTVFASLRRRARKQWGVTRGQCDAVTFVQRFGDALNLNIHFHSLLLDGVYAPGPNGALRFHPLPPPEDAEVERVVAQAARRITLLLERRGLSPEADPAEADPLAEDQPLLAQLCTVPPSPAASPRGAARASAWCAWETVLDDLGYDASKRRALREVGVGGVATPSGRGRRSTAARPRRGSSRWPSG